MVSSPESLNMRIDEEESQSRARVAISVVSFIAFSAYGISKGLDQGGTLLAGLTTIVSYLLFSVVWYAMVKRYPGACPRRRLVTIITDLGIMTVFMHLGSQHVTSYYPIFLWVIIGNGIRFGTRFLQFGVGVGAVGFGSLLLFNEYWSTHLNLGAGLLVGVIVLPLFFMGVLARLRQVTTLEIELARSKLADKAKDQFLATMSHEIRTPMNGVLGMAEALRDTDLDDQQQEHLEIITRSTESLLHIINDILDYSKITANTLTIEEIPFDLKQVLCDVHQLLESTAKAKGIRLLFDYPERMPTHFTGDPMRVRQVVLNLVGNAIKFTEKGQVKLSCRTHPKDSSMVRLVVADTGVGIPEDRLHAVFKQFEQADNSTTRQFGGTGLGLAISRQLALMMGGDIRVRSGVGEGSEFTVDVKLARCEAPTPVAQPETDERAERRELPQFGYGVIVVEDNKFNQIVMKNLAKRIGIEVELAENGAEALEMVEGAEYDLIFMDIRMPVMNGHEATRRIRARADDRARLPILAITAEATKRDVAACLESGMNLHLAKPMRVLDLVTAIESLNLPLRQPA